MLSKKQRIKLDNMVNRYESAMKCVYYISPYIIKQWAERYRNAMLNVLQRQGKR